MEAVQADRDTYLRVHHQSTTVLTQQPFLIESTIALRSTAVPPTYLRNRPRTRVCPSDRLLVIPRSSPASRRCWWLILRSPFHSPRWCFPQFLSGRATATGGVAQSRSQHWPCIVVSMTHSAFRVFVARTPNRHAALWVRLQRPLPTTSGHSRNPMVFRGYLGQLNAETGKRLRSQSAIFAASGASTCGARWIVSAP